ncbi:MAG: glycosyltransferase family 9 protein [Tannerellaceae bacterium]|jgi:ADP-heptose:LPS heptosyltransferase|nr:glycosyltransferase family 9 protein [Tannerellaceae bacterium]
MARVLVIRLSAAGDVAMTIPVIYSVACNNPSSHFTFLTRAFLIPLFINRPPNLTMMAIDTGGGGMSVTSLLRFAWGCAGGDFDMVIDLHNVIRSRVLSLAFRLRGKAVHTLDKSRRERRQLTSRRHKRTDALRPVIERYGDVFREAGLEYKNTFTSLFDAAHPPCPPSLPGLDGEGKTTLIGIAPFAGHRGKIYPLHLMEEVVAALSNRPDVRVYLLGGRGAERDTLEGLAARYVGVTSVAGLYGLDTELAIISRLDLLVSMDSANMHFASLVATRVISIWGATHPSGGFYGYGQAISDAIGLPLSCRPCSIYGNRPCRRRDYACLSTLPPSSVTARLI